MARTVRPIVFLAASLCSACSAGGEGPPLVVGSEGSGGLPGRGGSGSGGNSLVVPRDASASASLSVHVESPPGVVVEFVTLSCSNECADVLAVARGGFPPYSYIWEDGSKARERRVCPTALTSYQIVVTDTGSTSPEFRRDPQTQTAALTAQVLNCPPDGGSRPPPWDAGGHNHMCLANGTFAGTAQINFASSFDAPPWVSCASTPDIYDQPLSALTFGALGLPPTDGNTVLRAISSIPSESVGQKLCAPLRAGTTYALKMDLYSPVGSSINPVSVKLDVWGSRTSCGKEQLLWTSPLPGPNWQAYCATLTPTADLAYLMLEPHFEAQESTVFVDNVMAVDACP